MDLCEEDGGRGGGGLGSICRSKNKVKKTVSEY